MSNGAQQDAPATPGAPPQEGAEAAPEAPQGSGGGEGTDTPADAVQDAPEDTQDAATITPTPAAEFARAVTAINRAANAKDAAVSAKEHTAQGVTDAQATITIAEEGRNEAIADDQTAAGTIDDANTAGRAAARQVTDAVNAYADIKFS